MNEETGGSATTEKLSLTLSPSMTVIFLGACIRGGAVRLCACTGRENITHNREGSET